MEELSKVASQRMLDDVYSFQTKEILLGLASSEVLRARVTERQWHLRRSSGVQKASTQLQSALRRFKQFLECYSGLVEIIKQADTQYGGLAYATLSVFLVVCKANFRSSIPDVDTSHRSLKTSRRQMNSSLRLWICFIEIFQGLCAFVIFVRPWKSPRAFSNSTWR
jgi:hypothetical protein